jgi:hypothetical protein
MNSFCRDDPAADAIPMVVTGRATVYAWRCADGAPAIERQITEADARGYLANPWYKVARPETEAQGHVVLDGACPAFPFAFRLSPFAFRLSPFAFRLSPFREL